MMDPLGLALENFDARRQVAHARRDRAAPIDASGALPDGTTFDGAEGLRAAAARARTVFVMTLTEKLLTYALGRGVEYYDQPAVRAIVRDAAGERLPRSRRLIVGVVQSAPFQMRTVK